MGSVIEATAETFRGLVAEGTVLVDVWGPRCAPCIALTPHVEQLAGERPDVKVIKVDATKARRLCMELRVMGLPAFLLLEDGNEVARLAERDPSPEHLRAWLDEALRDARTETGREVG